MLTNPTIRSTDGRGDAAGLRGRGRAGARVSTETLNLPALNDVDVGDVQHGPVTAEQTQLFNNRNNVWGGRRRRLLRPVHRAGVQRLRRPSRPGRPGAVVAQGARIWTMAHEVGHVLGLAPRQRQQPSDDRQRHRQHHQPAAGPDREEVITMRASALTYV